MQTMQQVLHHRYDNRIARHPTRIKQSVRKLAHSLMAAGEGVTAYIMGDTQEFYGVANLSPRFPGAIVDLPFAAHRNRYVVPHDFVHLEKYKGLVEFHKAHSPEVITGAGPRIPHEFLASDDLAVKLIRENETLTLAERADALAQAKRHIVKACRDLFGSIADALYFSKKGPSLVLGIGNTIDDPIAEALAFRFQLPFVEKSSFILDLYSELVTYVLDGGQFTGSYWKIDYNRESNSLLLVLTGAAPPLRTAAGPWRTPSAVQVMSPRA